MPSQSPRYKSFLLFLVLLLILPAMLSAQNGKLTFEDIMKWEDISDVEVSDDGNWLIYSVWPDRGDGEARVLDIGTGSNFTIERGENPEITSDGQWVGAYVKPPLAKQLRSDNNDKPVQGFGLLNTNNGETVELDSVKSFAFSNDSRWLAVLYYQSKEIEEMKSKNKELGTGLLLKNLQADSEITIPFVNEMSFDSTSTYLAYSVVDTSGTENGIYTIDLGNEALSPVPIQKVENGLYQNLSWNGKNRQLAYTSASMDTTYEAGDADIQIWNSNTDALKTAVDADEVDAKWALRSHNDLQWTKDGKRLFFGVLDRELIDIDKQEQVNEQDTSGTVDIYDPTEILDDKEVDVWHWDDPRIKTHEKETWNRRKNHLYRAVYHHDSDEWVQLADEKMPEVDISQNPEVALGNSQVPYLKLMTWDGFYNDYYVVDLQTGQRQKAAEKIQYGADLSPGGNYIIYYDDRDWHLYDVENELYRNLTQANETPFYNEDHDYPSAAPGYGVGGWIEDDEAVLIYDKYDIWKFPVDGGDATNLTVDGRDRQISYRVVRLDPEQPAFGKREELLLRGYYDKKKNYGFYTARVSREGTTRRLEAEKKFDFVTKAKDSDRVFYTRESYDEYPNIWLSEGMRFNDVRQLTDLHTDLHEKYNWGTAELIDWKSLDGETIQGALIKPDNYVEGKKYPVLIYYYRFFSQRAYEFSGISNNHRPTLPQWVSDEYVVFLPDIRFEVGTPGFASTKSLVPGVQKLIDMGVADPDKLGLHGHSWSGYQTAFMITQTDIFDAAIAGAPVSNMTSAYSGIRWGSGLARQFQYEQSQSRIGGSLWEYPELYIENSPVFYADRIETPLLIMFGDEDTAVPWYQGIELYLAMRRLEKDAVFLQYRGEPHHLQEYPNRLDYAIKMKEYFDHYLKGKPAPDWIEQGVPYRGE
ncbi:S9 family peptidase [Balneolaceae bacterium YR4-1]|uniref:S9 family peptidase n=1 Tax=Halalkalibaculum roseum TaxID=2709311 RepID=A0A6M1TAW5_9BACT|nr:prolyl oligopeptidase family serine peptidase [Halalkalibaculum roseum]NGP77293.1 S9 family peptidase [Halalkalibaculum roseum]